MPQAITAATPGPATAPSREDALLEERARLALRAAGYGPLRYVEVSACDGAVALWGHVPSYHLKQVAQEAVLSARGALRVHNRLEVVCPNERRREG
jgi:osmotically-inducible protein OsmY